VKDPVFNFDGKSSSMFKPVLRLKTAAIACSIDVLPELFSPIIALIPSFNTIS